MAISFLEKIMDKLSFSFLNRKNSDNNKSVIKDSIVGDVAGRDLHKISLSNYQNINASNLEKKVLKVLYVVYKESGTNGKKIPHTYEVLKIKDGTDVSTLNDSKLIRIEGNFFKMTSDGIRYMDNLTESEINSIILPEEQIEIDQAKEIQNKRFEENRRNFNKNSCK